MIDEEEIEKLDWANIRDVSDLEEWKDGLYDYSEHEEDIYANKIANGLSDSEIMEAAFWKFFTRGLILMVGKPGSGKNMFAIHMGYKMKKLFGKTIILDYKPRAAYGEHAGLYVPFSKDFLVDQIDRISELVEVTKGKPISKDGWWCSRGRVMLQNSFIHLDEFKKYMPRETSNTNMSNAMNSLFTVWRHMDTMILSSCTKEKDIAYKGLEEITCKIKTSWIGTPRGQLARQIAKAGKNAESEFWAMYVIQMARFVQDRGVTVNYGKAIPYYLDGASLIEPNDPECTTRWIDLYNTKDPKAIRISKSFRKQKGY